MERRAEITSGIRILGILLLSAALLVAVLHLSEPRMLRLKDSMDSMQAANRTSSQPYITRGGFVVSLPSANGDPFSVTGQVIWTLFLATIVALPLSEGLLRFYRRAVVKSMRHKAGNSQIEQSRPSDEPRRCDSVPPQVVVIDHLSPAALTSAARRLLWELTRLPWMTAAVFALAGIGFALVTSIAVLMSGHARLSSTRLLTLGWIYAWPGALAINLVAATTKRTRITVVVLYFAGYLLLSAIAVAISPKLTWGQVLELWMINNLVPTTLLMIFINRRIRAVGPLVLLLMILGVYGALTAPFLLFSQHTEPLTRLMLGAFGAGHAFTAAQVLGFAALGTGGWFTLQYVRHCYEQKKLSDQIIVLGAMWLQFAAYWFVVLAFAGYAWMLTVVPAFIVYALLVRGGFRLPMLRARSRRQGRRLLLLRVFTLGNRSERLFEMLAKYWRYVGSIMQIAGPDLATATVQPHEFLDFMGGKLTRRFIDGSAALNLRLAESDNRADADGRFRVNDFFCHDDTWKPVLDRLVRDCDAILMDLRGFSADNAGCIFEIDELINVVPMERVVLVTDSTTDVNFLRATMIESWRKMLTTSPNQRCDQFRVFRFGLNEHAGLADLFRALCAAAEAAPPFPPSASPPASGRYGKATEMRNPSG